MCSRPFAATSSYSVNAHAEELRQYFVAHDGQKSISVEDTFGSDYASMTRQFVRLIQEMVCLLSLELHGMLNGSYAPQVVDSTFVEWILPDFTTTTEHDRTIGSMALMSTLKAYVRQRWPRLLSHIALNKRFSTSYANYLMSIACGIPSVTLEGEKSDWEDIYRRLSRLSELGDEPAVWAGMLRPIIRRFISAFDGEPDVAFWNHVADLDACCGQDDWSGWITAFCVWSPKGKWMPRTPASETVSRGIPQDGPEGSVRERGT